MIELKSNLKNYSIVIPTSIVEVKKEDLDAILGNIKVADNYCIIAMVHKLKLFELLASANKQNTTVQIVPLIAKLGLTNSKLCCGEKAIIRGSDLERGIHLNLTNNVLSHGVIFNYIQDDVELKKDIMSGEYFKVKDEVIVDSKKNVPYCYFIEFKIIPICDIVSSESFEVPKLTPHAHQDNVSVN